MIPDPNQVFYGRFSNIGSGDVWDTVTTLDSGKFYYVQIFTRRAFEALTFPLLSAWTGIEFSTDPVVTLFNVDPSTPPNRHINAQSSPSEFQWYEGLGIGTNMNAVFTFADGPTTTGEILIIEITGAFPNGVGITRTFNEGLTPGVLTNPSVVIPGDESIVTRFGVVQPSPAPGAGSGLITMTSPTYGDIVYGDTASLPDAHSSLSGVDDGTSLVSWTAPETATALAFTYDTPGDGVWSTSSIGFIGSPAPVTGWYVGQVGWRPS